MRDMAANSELLRALLARQVPTRRREFFRTGWDAMDDLAPEGGLRCGATHELLFDSGGSCPKLLALLLARAAQAAMDGVIVWSDPKRELNAAAASAAGIDLRRMILLRPSNAEQEISALGECLRCRGVSATVAGLNRLSGVEARRLQLAAENGGGVGIFLRPMSKSVAGNYAAATRWLVRSSLENEESQSWIVELLHGHGGRIGSGGVASGAGVLLEVDRETGDVRASAQLADRPAATPSRRATA
jgi:protein ImuA